MSPLGRPKLKDSNFWTRFKARWNRSGVVILGLIQSGASAVLEGINQLGNIVTNPEFKSALYSISVPTYVTTLFGVLGLVTIYIRLRPTSPDPLV